MTENEKLLFTDISGRVGNVYISTPDGVQFVTGISVYEGVQIDYNGRFYALSEIKPYLRPMSSMTEEERKEYDVFCIGPYLGIDEDTASNFIDWLNRHHFDYRGLIEKGLASEAPTDMYNHKIN